jgi:hypothetical protein
MKISGFSMVKNADKLYYPIKQSIMSILPIVDEFVIAVGDCDSDDRTREIIESINDPKVKIIDTVWDIEKYPNGMENAHQSNIAKDACSGDWLIYLQADEVIHEKYLPAIEQRCRELLDDKEVEGMLLKYLHFWGDYRHYQYSHGWYKKEIRIIRNDPEIYSWVSAQSFRRIPNFDGKNFRQKKGTYKLKVVDVDAYVYHYGWVRPPHLMRNKMKALSRIHKGSLDNEHINKIQNFDYGPLNRTRYFKDTHPAVMKDWIAKFDWEDQLQYSGKPRKDRRKLRHERIKNRIVSWIENKLLGGGTIGGSKNYIKLRR